MEGLAEPLVYYQWPAMQDIDSRNFVYFERMASDLLASIFDKIIGDRRAVSSMSISSDILAV
jgi:hypothetical protein